MNYYKFDDLDVGLSFEFKEVVTEEKMKLFLKLSGDNNTLHCDEEYAKKFNMKGRVVYGMLASSFCSIFYFRKLYRRGRENFKRNRS